MSDTTWVAPEPVSHDDGLTLRAIAPDNGWGELSIDVLGDLRARPRELSAGSFQIADGDLGEITRFAVAQWLRDAAGPDWLRIHDFCVRGQGIILYDWVNGQAAQRCWIELMGLGA